MIGERESVQVREFLAGNNNTQAWRGCELTFSAFLVHPFAHTPAGASWYYDTPDQDWSRQFPFLRLRIFDFQEVARCLKFR